MVNRQSFNDGWRVAAEQHLFAAVAAPAPQVEVVLPHDAMRDLARDPHSSNGSNSGYYPSAHVVYEKSLIVPRSWAQRTVALEFEGVYRDAMVYLNGNLVAQRPNGYSPFLAPLDPYLEYGSVNHLRVESRAHQDSRWYTGVGIYRNVWLLVSDPVHIPIDGVSITTPEVDETVAAVAVAVTVRNETRTTESVRIRSMLYAPDGSMAARQSAPLTVLAGDTGVVRLRHWLREPEIWDIDNPSRYSLELTVTDADGGLRDTDESWFGIRTVQVDPGRGLRLNGRSVKLRGGCVHHDNGPLGAAAVDRAEHRKAELIKAAGFNAVRSAHNGMSRAFLDACDRIGLLVINELTDVWTSGKSSYDLSLTFADWWERDLTALVLSSRNHPSVIMYSIGNEILEIGRPGAAIWGRRLAEKVRVLDATRPVTNAVNGLVAVLDSVVTARDQRVAFDFNTALSADGSRAIGASPEVTRLTEEAHAQVDVAGINYAESRYDLDAELFPDRIVLGTESFPGRLDRIWPLVLKHPQVLGDFAWTAWDHLGEAGTGRAYYDDDPLRPVGLASPYPWLVSHAGTIDITGVRRPISYWREIVWGLRDEPYLAVHRPQGHGRTLRRSSWAWDDVLASWAWDIPPGSPVIVDVYADADDVELLLDGESLGVATVNRTAGETVPAFAARFEVFYGPGELVAVARRGGAEFARSSLRSPCGVPELHAHAERTRIIASPADLAYVHLELRDDAGTLCVDRSDRVRVSIDGPGVLAGFAGAKPDETAGFGGDAHDTFEGRLLAIVRPTGPGDIRVRATGTTSGTVVVTVTAVSPGADAREAVTA
ncbi:glycoside hydrolase family 2 TIM barrel-domain containing protein [Nocardia aurantia]|uniref:Beta-galactosidase BoGH2A n=1 Tax=Nocardia aurantia TaxID=2585199 RepID=A0A7K0DYR6_9NOCA|nr:glycoside hydrolase family 2 TIM barrel-domain containing protein [Nocardia aurantia]MQY30949.1 Beta-galactosidase BoGH2A [Nocardia aurantia]